MDSDAEKQYLRLKPSLPRVFGVQILSYLAVVGIVVAFFAARGDAEFIRVQDLAIFVLIASGLRTASVAWFGLSDVVVDDHLVSGPSGGLRGVATFPLATIDIENSSQRTIWRRVTGSIVIRSRAGARITLLRPEYCPDELEELLGLLASGSAPNKGIEPTAQAPYDANSAS